MPSSFSTPAILLRRVDFGDDDLILTFFTSDRGKVTAIAKSAKKSIRRFSGILDMFSVLHVVCVRSRGLPILHEAELKQAFTSIRSDIKKAAYASYWAELINEWIEADEQQIQLYHLFQHVLEALDIGMIPAPVLSILFQMRFMKIGGFYPNLSHCGICGAEMETMRKNRVMFDIPRGEMICEKCEDAASQRVFLSKGTIKQLLWIADGDLEKAGRIRFTPLSLKEGLNFLETFVPYHIGKTPRSLGFLRQIRK